MWLTYKYILRGIVAILFATMLFSCQNGLDEARKFDGNRVEPLTIGEGVNLFYTDSGKVKANLRSPKMLDFTNQQFAYREFPNGVEVDFFNEKREKIKEISAEKAEVVREKTREVTREVKERAKSRTDGPPTRSRGPMGA